MDANDDLLTPGEAAAYLKVAVKSLSIWRSTKRYNLAYVKVGRLIRYRRSDLQTFVSERAQTSI